MPETTPIKNDASKTMAPAAKDEKATAPKADEKATDSKAATAEEAPDAARLAEAKALGLDPRLDNRLGDQRPELVEWPAKPQQIDGPEIGDDWAAKAEQAGQIAEKFTKDDFIPAGMKSEGPHGLGGDDITVGNDNSHVDPK